MRAIPRTGSERGISPDVISPMRALAVVTMWLAIFTVLFLAFQIWGTGLYTARAQDTLAQDLDADVPTPEVSTPGTSPPPSTVAPRAAPDTDVNGAVPRSSPQEQTERAVAVAQVTSARPGEAIARLTMPRLGTSHVVVEGVDVDSLRTGPGRYPTTALLGTTGNAAVAGHRSTYGAPFAALDELRPGDEIRVETPLGTAVYEVMDPLLAFSPWIERVRSVGPGHVIVGPDDGFVLADVSDDRLTLTSCHPRFSARERLIVAARLVSAPLSATPVDLVSPPAPVGQDPVHADSGAGGGAAPQQRAAPVTGDPTVRVPVLTTSSAAQVPDLREGLSGMSFEILPTLVWPLALVVAMVAAAAVRHRWGMVVAWATGVVPVGAILWMLFTHLDRMLPAY